MKPGRKQAAEAGRVNYFPSRRDRWLGAVVWAVILLPVLFVLFPPNPEERLIRALTAAVPLTPAAVMVAWMWCSTGYTVTDLPA